MLGLFWRPLFAETLIFGMDMYRVLYKDYSMTYF